jgi:hypothetical protein
LTLFPSDFLFFLNFLNILSANWHLMRLHFNGRDFFIAISFGVNYIFWGWGLELVGDVEKFFRRFLKG